MLAVTSFDTTNSVVNIIDENNIFSISIPEHWRFSNYLGDGIVDKLKSLQKLRSENDIELKAVEVRKRGDKTKLKSEKDCLSDFDTSKGKKLEELKSATYHDFEDLV